VSAEIELLLVEDDHDFRDTCARWMQRKGHFVEQAANGQEALALCERRQFQVAIVDMNMPGISGIELLERMKSANIESEVIILTGQGTIENAVESMKLGACDYLTKPFPLAELEHRCQLAYQRAIIRKENRQLKAVIALNRPKVELIGRSQRMQAIRAMVEKVAPTEKAVLIEGESGTGKEVVARQIQQLSKRADKPFVTINCAALPEQLVESELFGHQRGAFTGAMNDKTGLFEVADGGTLFVDEIGDLPRALQPKLLRVLEDGTLRRVGSNKERRVNVRILSATNKNLSAEVAAGRFREDLFYRINVLSLQLPPLREREDDTILLAQHFLGEHWQLSAEAVTVLENYHWPGNVRQLINVLDRATILAEDNTIIPADLPEQIADPPPDKTNPKPTHSQKLDEMERAHIIDVLHKEKGNKARTARALGIHRRKLYRLLERYKIHNVEQQD